MTARALAIAHTCMFDAWAAYDHRADGTRFGGTLRQPKRERTLANKTSAVSYAAHRALSDLFPTQIARFDATLRDPRSRSAGRLGRRRRRPPASATPSATPCSPSVTPTAPTSSAT